ncbi:hypothetical protein PHISP_04189 [Aspergillus sp. HF37]|nr:hypothetical protein PHISP_04189 [Aspergillus sp. HF37]
MTVNTDQRTNRSHRIFHVPPNTSEYQYRGRKHFRNVLGSENRLLEDKDGKRSQFIIFSNINEQTFEKVFADPSDATFARLYSSYIPGFGLLLVKMVTQVHEQAHKELATTIMFKLHEMNNLDRELQKIGRAEFGTNSRRKKADASFRPVQLPASRSDKWPTMIIEAGYSGSSKDTLDAGARWWLKESERDVKIALTILVSRTRREIVIDDWEIGGMADEG